ncbi:hypothetical protein OsI_01681 [Oryza sativa Indica Group]|uniref:Uncharacterized protein n=1 Tax=Oryza sativa subsp. indica TaxID=39946 RepID=B8A756_ORYSI|nr:hypothetical protein OsI_01681 [Oryza sativa Indica Group]
MVCSPEKAGAACPECLERRILSGLPGSCFSFVHGLHESPLPFASAAVVQIASDGAEECNGSQQSTGYFVLVGLQGGKELLDIQECESNSLENGSQIDLQGKESTDADDNHRKQSIINTITKLTPTRYLARAATSEIRELISSYLNLTTEESVMNSLNLLSENKIVGSGGLDFLNFTGFSEFNDIHPSGHVVNSICILSITGRVASCDGTIHIWNGPTGKLIAAHAESSTTFPLQTASIEQANMLNQDALSGGILSNAFRGSLYTTMHYMESKDKLVAGMGNGSIRFIDISQDQKLHLWKSDSDEISFSSLVSAICSCASDKLKKDSTVASSSWIAAGLSSGYCRLLDERSGNIVAVWRAHDGHITKLAAPEDHLIVSSSLDKTLRVWDLRGNLATQSNIFRSHSDGISNFSVWGQDVVSISRNKIALTSLSRPTSDMDISSSHFSTSIRLIEE